MEKKWLFHAGQGWGAYRIPGLIRTAKGTLLAYCESRLHTGMYSDDWATRGVALKRSEDGGITWSELMQPVLFRSATAVNNPVMISCTNGDVHFLWETDYTRLYHQISHDDGITFSTPQEIHIMETYRPLIDWTVFAVGPGHGIETAAGVLMVPVWIAKGRGREHFPSVNSIIRSEDGGKTWKAGDIIDNIPPEFNSPNETTIAELPSGGIYVNIRHRGTVRCRYSTFTPNGQHFDPIKQEPSLPDPWCFGSVVRAGNDLAFVNCASEKHRNNTTIRLSQDGGKTWCHSRLIEDGISGYADMAFDSTGENGVCLYERSYSQGGEFNPQGLCVVRFSKAFLTDET